jgi:RNA polymerase sigma-70 factor (ECF subfamily)
MIEDYNKTDEDRALVEAVCSREDRFAFDRLVAKYQDKIFNLCFRFMGNYHDANDCAQDAFVKAYRSLKKFKFQSAFSTWLYRIAVNTCKNKLDSLPYRFGKVMVRLQRDNADDPPIEIKDESRSPEVEFERAERSKHIQKAINALPGDQTSVVVLRDVEGLSYDEISEITGYNLGTVKSKLFRAREELRKKLKGLV